MVLQTTEGLASESARDILAVMHVRFNEHPFLRAVDPPAFWRWVARQRWFGGKARTVLDWSVRDTLEVGAGLLIALEITYADGGEVYTVPVQWSVDAPEEAIVLEKDGRKLCDATALPEFRDWLFRMLQPRAAASRLFPDGNVPVSRVLKAEQSNTSIIYGDKLFLKFYRRLVTGENPDAELTRYLSEVAHFPHVPAFGGVVTWNDASVALATEMTPNEGDAWPLALATAREYFATGSMGNWLEHAALLGRRTGEMHTALTAATEADFAPEPFTEADLEALRAEIARLDGSNRATLAGRVDSLPASVGGLAKRYLAGSAASLTVDLPTGAVKTRTHGDYHLGQVLWTGADFVIIDFEGEPSRSLAERRAKRSPLRDVAGMLRSFHYAAYAAGGGTSAEKWAVASQGAFLGAWKQAAPGLLAGLGLLPFFIREKALYELSYELNNRPDWVRIPLQALA